MKIVPVWMSDYVRFNRFRHQKYPGDLKAFGFLVLLLFVLNLLAWLPALNVLFGGELVLEDIVSNDFEAFMVVFSEVYLFLMLLFARFGYKLKKKLDG